MTDVIDGHPMINTRIVALKKDPEPIPCEFPVLMLRPHGGGEPKFIALVASEAEAEEIGRTIHATGLYAECSLIVHVEMDLRKVATKMSVT